MDLIQVKPFLKNIVMDFFFFRKGQTLKNDAIKKNIFLVIGSVIKNENIPSSLKGT